MRVTVATTELGTLACLYCCVLSLVPLASVAWILAAGTLVVLWVTAAWRQVRANGLLSYASPELRKLMLDTCVAPYHPATSNPGAHAWLAVARCSTLLEWMQDSSFLESLEKWKPFLLPMDASEVLHVMPQGPHASQVLTVLLSDSHGARCHRAYFPSAVDAPWAGAPAWTGITQPTAARSPCGGAYPFQCAPESACSSIPSCGHSSRRR